MIKTPICDLLGIEYPIFQGGMAWIADGKLAAAVSEGGGLGIIAAGNASADYVREQIHIVRGLTEKPFGVNVMLMSPSVNEVAAVLAEEHVPVITTGAGNPGKHMKAWKTAGCKVIPVVASVAMAKLMTRLGASALIAEGGESGGHVGDLTTMVLVPQVCDATTLPVLAAGGIADGRACSVFSRSWCWAMCWRSACICRVCRSSARRSPACTALRSRSRRLLSAPWCWARRLRCGMPWALAASF